jgi:VWFA-related protein
VLLIKSCFISPNTGWLIALSIAMSCHAQTGTQQPSPVYTLRSGTNLVIEDVVVTDTNHNPVHNLKAGDFTVAEDGQVQHIRTFEEHSPASPASAKSVAIPKVAPGIFTNFSTVPKEGPVNLLLLDTLNTPLRDQFFVRSQLLDYLKKASSTQIAIFGLSRRLSILQGFTANPDLLKAALTNKSAIKSSSLLDDPNGGGGGVSPSAVSDTLTASGASAEDPNLEQTIANVQQFEAETSSFQLQLRVRYTLDALNELARYLAGIPGRKNLIWFSGSFPLNVKPDGDLQNSFAGSMNLDAEFRETMNLLARSQVAVYPIDARGLTTSPVYGVVSSGAKYAQGPQAAGKDEMKFAQQIGQENETMRQMAEDTGGRAFVNTNGLSDAVTKVVEAGSSYYTLTYSPTNLETDGRFRRLSVELRDKSLALSYRRGYYAADPESIAKASHAEAAATSQSLTPVVDRVMMRGSPTPTQILFTVRVLPASQSTEERLAAGNSLTTDGEKLKGEFRRYTIDLVADQRSLVFAQTPDGLHHGAFEFLTAVYDQNGTLINRTGNTVHADLSTANFAHFLQTPLSFNQDISVPVKGEYFLRIAIHDLGSDRAGAVEVPVDTVSKLPPLEASPPPSPASPKSQ